MAPHQAWIIVTSTLQWACSIRAPELDPRHPAGGHAIEMFVADDDQVGLDLGGVVGDLADGFAHRHFAHLEWLHCGTSPLHAGAARRRHCCGPAGAPGPVAILLHARK